MSTENQDKKLPLQDRSQPLPKKLGKIDSQGVVEQVPAWLRTLLTKYQEKEGPLIGLGEVEVPRVDRPAEVPPPATGANLSALLEQMAEENESGSAPSHTPTSVEWGRYSDPSPEPPAASLDDLLANITVDPLGEAYPTEPFEAEAPDWITDLLPGAGPTGPAQLDPSASSAQTPPSQTAPGAEDVPDWLTEALETSPPPPKTPPASSTPPARPPVASGDSAEVPDWLAEALDSPASAEATPPPPAPEITPPPHSLLADQDVPDWLSPSDEMSVEPTSPEFAAATDTPDWLNDIMSQSDLDRSGPVGTATTGVTEDEFNIAVPDWLAELAPPTADEPEAFPPASTPVEVPDWITAGGADPVENEQKVGTLDQDVPDWITQGETSEPLAAPEQLFQPETPAFPAAPAADMAEVEDWLASFELPPTDASLPAATDTLPPLTSDDWFTNFFGPLPVGESLPTNPEAEASLTIDDWLADFEPGSFEDTVAPPPGEAATPAITTWPTDLDIDQLDTTDIGSDLETTDELADDVPAWLAGIDQPPPDEFDQVPPSTAQPIAEPASKLKKLRPSSPQQPDEGVSALPGWVASLVPASGEISALSPSLPDWASSLVPPSAVSTRAAHGPLPDWVKSLVPPGFETKAAPPEAASLRRFQPSTPAPAETISLRKPQGLTETAETPASLPPPDTTEAVEATNEALPWLSQLPEEDQAPDWLAELSGSLTTSPESAEETTAWLWDEATAAEDDQLAERLDWFTHPGEAATSATPPVQAKDTPSEEQETPGWLFDLPPVIEEADPLTSLGETEAGEELDVPDWLMESASTEEQGVPSWLANLPAEGDSEVPLWLANLPKEPAEALSIASEPEDETESEGPAWLDEAPDETAMSSAGDMTETQGSETPDWLADLVEPATIEAAPQAVEAEEEVVVSDWLADLLGPTTAQEWPVSPISMELSEAEEEVEIPAWLTGLDEIDLLDEEIPPASTPVEVTEAELEIPDWLADLPEPTLPAPAKLSEAETGAEAPLWPADWSGTPTEEEPEAEVLAWSAELSEPAAPVEVETEAAEAVPPWLAELPEAITPEQPFSLSTLVDTSPVEEPEDAPPWLTDLPQAPATGELLTASTQPDKEEFEAPSWLADLQEAPLVEKASSLPDSTDSTPVEEEEEMPAWLASLPRAPATGQLAIASLSTEEEFEAPSWLADLQEAPPVEEVPMASALGDTAQTEETLDVPPWLVRLPEAATDEEISIPPAVEAPDQVEAEQETPTWLADVSEPTAREVGGTEAETEVPPWLADWQGTPAEEMLEAETVGGMPAWLTDLPEPTAPVEMSEAEAEAEIPPWLAGLQAASTKEEPVWSVEALEAEEEQETPAWLTDLPEPTTPVEMGEAAAEVSPWLADLQRAPAEEGPVSSIDTLEEEELEIPSWLANLQRASTEEEPVWSIKALETEEEQETPAWLTDLPEPTTPVEMGEAEIETEAPPWLADWQEAGSPVDVLETEEELEIPSWLTSQTEPTAPIEMDEAAAEAEVPPWLTDLQRAPAEEMPVSSVEMLEAEAAQETPTWLTDLSEPTAPIEMDEAAAEAEVPPWLADLQGAPAEEMPVSSVEMFEAETAQETPTWLTDLSGPTAPIEMDEAEAEAEVPPWLADLQGARAPAEEIPVSSAEMLEAETAQETPAWLADMSEPTAPVEMDEAEVPPWLADLQGAPAEEMPVSSAEMLEAETAQETSAWLADMSEPTAPIEMDEVAAEAEVPPWLAGWQEAPAEEMVVSSGEALETEEELEIPAWLTSQREPTAPVEMDEAEAETEVPPWLADLQEAPAKEVAAPSATLEAPAREEEPAVPAWLAGQAEPTAPAEMAEVKEEQAAPDWLDELAEGQEVEIPELEWLVDLEESQVTETIPSPEETEPPALLAEEEPAAPDWLSGSVGAPVGDKVETISALEQAEEVETPEWLKDAPDLATPPAGESEPVSDIEAAPSERKPSRSIGAPSAGKSAPAGRLPDWLRALEPVGGESEGEDSKAVEETGVLAGLAGLLPAERVVTATPALEARSSTAAAQPEAMLAAAQDFYTVATQVPQPATLPAPLTRRDQLIGSVARALLYLMFIILVALPLPRAFQKTVDPATGAKGPWTEPDGALSEVLDKQRRELISNQLGIIDLQPPDSVALVSFDYTAGTQGEMEPLAEAVIGRLQGQGMRIMAISLEPEGAMLAQSALDKILIERNQELATRNQAPEEYGLKIVNLGYWPGQVAGVRELVAGRGLAGITDFKEGLTFQDAQRAGWSDIQSIKQVDVVVTLADNPVTARWWIEQMTAAVPPDDGERFLLAATSATADPFLRPYRASDQLDGLVSGINGAAAIEAGRQNFGPARQMLDSQSIAHLLIVILIAVGTMVGWMPPTDPPPSKPKRKKEIELAEAG